MPSYPAPSPDPTAPHQTLISAVQSGFAPTLPICPTVNVDPDVLAAIEHAPSGTHVVTARGHKVSS